MFDKHGYNMHPFDSNLRIGLGILLVLYTTYSFNIYFAIAALLLLYTGLKKFCFIYFFLKINENFSRQNYYLSFLPRYDPAAAFIFDIHGQVLFKNNAAALKLANINSVLDIHIDLLEHQNIIKHNLLETRLFESNNKYYQIKAQGISYEKFLLVYLADITKIVDLNKEIEETQSEVIYAMGEIGESRSKETGNHVKRVALYSETLALLYGLSSQDTETLKMASPMHDIGKVGIADSILNAPRKLTADEFEIMKMHAELGYNMLKQSKKPILQAAAIVAHEHHEKWDGTGYPRALKGEEIHIYGRITAIADVFDALGSKRVYKEAWEMPEILDYFNHESAKHFDPKLIALFMENIKLFIEIKDTFKD